VAFLMAPCRARYGSFPPNPVAALGEAGRRAAKSPFVIL
jgi:hypothetical protein